MKPASWVDIVLFAALGILSLFILLGHFVLDYIRPHEGSGAPEITQSRLR